MVERNKVGISFVSIFILIYHIFFWVCGLAHSLSWDYAPGVPQGEAANVHLPWREKPVGGFVWKHLLKLTHDEDTQETRGSGSADPQSRSHTQIELGSRHSSGARDEESASIEVVRRTPHSSVHSHQSSPAQSRRSRGLRVTPPVSVTTQPEVMSRSRQVLAAIAVVVTPISAIVAISLLIALVDPLKALFVSFEGGPSWRGPDGKPPLAFVIDTGFLFISPHSPTTRSDWRSVTAKLLGAITVPMTLILLGVSFARMDVKLGPKSGLPVSALLSVCAVKMILLPTVGVLVTRAMMARGLINPESKVQIFVAIFLSGTPSAIK